MSGGGLPEPERGEAVARLQVEVEAGGVHVVAGGYVAEVDAGVGLVGRLVLGEAGVALDAEERPAEGPGIGGEVAADLEKGLGQVLDEGEGREADLFLEEPRLVGFEPGTFVVLGQVAEESEEAWGEVALAWGQGTSAR